MTLPGTQVTVSSEAGGRGVVPNTGAWFVVGFTEKGPPGVPTAIRSLAEYVATFGDRVSYGYLYDALDVFFREGGTLAYVTRVVGPTPVKASANLLDQSGSSVPGDVALAVTAKDAGAWANTLNVEVTVSGSSFTIIVTDDTDGALETSPLLADRTEAVAWAADSGYIDLALGASNEDPRAQGPTSLTSGDDDRSNATDSTWVANLAYATSDYGPGQVSAPGKTTQTVHEGLLAHASNLNRIALLDLADTANESTLITAVDPLRNDDGAKVGAAFAPWAVVPGITPGTTRTVPYSAVQAGLIGRLDAQGISPNVPAAGVNGVSAYADDLSQDAWTDAEREDLADGGITVARILSEQIRTYDLITLVDPLVDDLWLNLYGSRLVMAIKASAELIAERFLFAQVDGKGLKVADLEDELKAVCIPYYAVGSLYGETPEDAFTVSGDFDHDTNTLSATLELATSPGARRVEITIVRRRAA